MCDGEALPNHTRSLTNLLQVTVWFHRVLNSLVPTRVGNSPSQAPHAKSLLEDLVYVCLCNLYLQWRKSMLILGSCVKDFNYNDNTDDDFMMIMFISIIRRWGARVREALSSSVKAEFRQPSSYLQHSGIHDSLSLSSSASHRRLQEVHSQPLRSSATESQAAARSCTRLSWKGNL